MKSVSDGLDSISVSVYRSIINRSSTSLIYLSILLIALGPIVQASPLETALLTKLGITRPPKSTTPSPPIPQHFIDLYRQTQEEGMLDQDSIRLFYPQELLDLNAGLLLSYNLSLEAQQARKEKVIGAHLKLRVRRRAGASGPAAIRIYRVDDVTRLRVERLLDSVEVVSSDENDEPIIDLDVTEAVPYSNQKHMIRILIVFPSGVTLADSPTHSLSSLPLSRSASATMVVRYMDREEGDQEEESDHPKRRKRSLSEDERMRKERKERKRKNRKHKTGGEKGGVCHRKPLYIDFTELSWNDWIIAPVGYEAFQCSGRCPYPFPASMNSTNHAIIQGLLHNYNDEVPEPCCVPTEMAPLTILFNDGHNNIAVREYPDMIVLSCGCR